MKKRDKDIVVALSIIILTLIVVTLITAFTIWSFDFSTIEQPVRGSIAILTIVFCGCGIGGYFGTKD